MFPIRGHRVDIQPTPPGSRNNSCDLLLLPRRGGGPSSVRTLRNLNVHAGACRKFFKLTGSIDIIHPFG